MGEAEAELALRPLDTGGAEEDGDDELSLDAMERRYVQQVLLKTGGNKSAAARILDISRPRLDRMIDRHRLVF